MTVSVQDTAPVFSNVVVTFDGIDVGASITTARLETDQPILELRTLSGVRKSAGRASKNLVLEGAQDWHEVQNLTEFLRANSQEDATLVMTWTGANGETSARTMTVTCVEPQWGGTADELATFSVTLPITGTVTVTDSAGS